MTETPPSNAWPSIPVADWQATRDTLHLWTQIVGKVRMANTSSSTTGGTCRCMSPTAGSTTGLIPHDARAFEVAFDFIGDRLDITTSDGKSRADGTGTAFGRELLRRVHGSARRARAPHHDLAHAGRDTGRDPLRHRRDAHRLRRRRRCTTSGSRSCRWIACSTCSARRFIGKSSPVHLFWGALDLAVTRFSGRDRTPAPRRRAQLRAVRHARGVLPRGQQRGLLARRRRRGPLLLVRLSRNRRATATSRSLPRRPDTTRGYRSSYCPTRPCAPPPIPMPRCSSSCSRRMTQPRTAPSWDRAALERP